MGNSKQICLTLIFVAFLFVTGCVSSSFDEIPPWHDQVIHSEMLIFDTEDVRVAKVTAKAIVYEYDDTHMTLAQLGKHAQIFCRGKGKDTVLIENSLGQKDGFRQAKFECQEHPVLVPNY